MQGNNTSPLAGAILIAAVLIGGAIIYKKPAPEGEATPAKAAHESAPSPAAALLVPWGDLGQRLVSVGVIDREKFLALYTGEAREEARRIIEEAPESIQVTERNAGIMLNALWALGLAQKSTILEKGEMVNPAYGGAERFASTGGWTISAGHPMEHYSKHLFMKLSPEEERDVHTIASGVYRPCCDNGTHFPDCNHGMAMLGLLELLTSKGRSEDELYGAAVTMSRLWFPDHFAITEEYARQNRITEEKALVSAALFSSSGFRRIAELVKNPPSREGGSGGGGCSV